MKNAVKYSLLSILLSFVALALIIGASAEGETDGYCGDNLTWDYNSETKTLTIDGYGAMWEFKSEEKPWYNYVEEIEHVILADGITSISPFAFYNCEKLTEIHIPDTVTDIGIHAFSNCKSLETVTLSSNLSLIPDGCFKDCTGLKRISIPDSVTEISQHAFWKCSMLSEVDLGNGVQVIEHGAFRECISLQDVIFPDSLIKIDGHTFQECDNLRSVVLGKNVKYLYDNAFRNCKRLSSVTLNEGLEHLSAGAFDGCERLSTLVVPESVKRFPCDNFPDWHITALFVKSQDAIAVMQNHWDMAKFPSLKKIYFSCDNAQNLSCFRWHNSQENVTTVNGTEYYCFNIKFESLFSHDHVESYDEYHHYKECTRCGNVTEKQIHRYEKETIVKLPFFSKDGVKKEICDCGYFRYKTVPPTANDTIAAIVLISAVTVILIGVFITVYIKRKRKNAQKEL